ncbi:MAG: MFS transporter [Synergistaceae bacterium]|nr:MFS transporter [Synergistaceae bacterium]
MLNFFKVPIVMGILAQEMSLADPAILMSVFTFVGIIFAVPAALIINKFGPKTMCMAACILVGLGAIMGSLSGSANMLIFSRAIEGLGYILISVAAPVVIATSIAPCDIGVGMGIWAIWMPAGQIVAFNLTQALIGSITWKNIWMIYAVITIALSFVLVFTIKKPQGSYASAPTEEKETGAIGKLLGNKNFLCAVLSFMVFNYLLIQLTTFIPSFAAEKGIMEPTEAAFAGTVVMICTLASSPILGRVGDKFGRKKIYVIALIAAGLGTAIAFSGSRFGVYAGSVIYGLIGMAAPGTVLAAISDIVGPKLNSLATGFTFIGVNGGQFLATVVFAPLLKAAGGNYTSAIMMSAVPLAIIAVILAAIAKYE